MGTPILSHNCHGTNYLDCRKMTTWSWIGWWQIHLLVTVLLMHELWCQRQHAGKNLFYASKWSKKKKSWIILTTESLTPFRTVSEYTFKKPCPPHKKLIRAENHSRLISSCEVCGLCLPPQRWLHKHCSIAKLCQHFLIWNHVKTSSQLTQKHFVICWNQFWDEIVYWRCEDYGKAFCWYSLSVIARGTGFL